MKLPVTVLFVAATALAADHVDSPLVVEDPATDITDLYAWMSPDGARVELAMAISGAQFAPGVQYVFHVGSASAYGAEQTETTIICTFDRSQSASCWVGDEDRIAGNAQVETGIVSDSGRVRLFTGLREDAFYFNAGGFSAVIAAIKKAEEAGPIPKDEGGCPQLDPATASTLAAGLARGSLGGPPMDLFIGPVATLVMEVDKDLLTKGGPILAVWASTRQ